jgi:hypothetical protein
MSQGTLAWEPPPSLEILPASGMTQNGQLFERPTLEHHTSASDGFVSLPTPRAQNGESRNMNIWKRPLNQLQNLENALALLPTPTARDWKDTGENTNYERQAKKSLLAGVVMSRLFDVGNEP